MSKWIFVIDTDSYAGNFERDLCAYITGVIGDCGVGKEMAELYCKDTGEEESRFLELLKQTCDGGPCYRPCDIYKSPNSKEYLSVAIFFNDRPSDGDIAFMKKRAMKFAESKLNIIGFRLLREVMTIQSFQI